MAFAGLAREGALEGFVQRDDNVEPGEREDLEDSWRRDHDVKATLGLAHVLERRDQDAESGRVDEADGGEVDDHVAA